MRFIDFALSAEYKWNAKMQDWIWTDDSKDDGRGRFVRDTGSDYYSDDNDEDDAGSGIYDSNVNERGRVRSLVEMK